MEAKSLIPMYLCISDNNCDIDMANHPHHLSSKMNHSLLYLTF